MKTFRFLLVLALMLLILPIASTMAQNSNTNEAWKKIASLGTPMPKVEVVNGIELKMDGVSCRLFGVRLPQNDELANKAKRFLNLYMKNECGNIYYFIYNAYSPVNSKDGVPLIWLSNSGSGWAQETLVQAGLVDVDYKGFEEYSFELPGKERNYVFDWKKCLADAVEWHKSGKKPKVINFEWHEDLPSPQMPLPSSKVDN